jgi:hypothetical protein
MPSRSQGARKTMNPPGNPYRVQWRMLEEIATCRDRAKHLFGIEYVFLVLVCAGLMLMPAMCVRAISGRFSYLSRKLAIEGYVVAKPLVLSFVLFSGRGSQLF